MQRYWQLSERAYYMAQPVKLLLFAFSTGVALAPAISASQWNVEKLSLTPQSEITGRLTARISGDGSEFEINSDVRLTALNNHFLYRNRLVVIGKVGQQGQASGVVIFDLTGRTLLDWFVCWEATRISESWIALVEWYPPHGMRWPTDVVLVYDLDTSPTWNRVGVARLAPVPPPLTDGGVAVGIPVYPRTNAVEESYTNVVPSAESAISVLGSPGFLLLPSRWLVFVAAQGTDYQTLQNHLVVVDLSHGLINPPARTIEIPTHDFAKLGRNPRMIQVDGMEPVSEHEVRLLLPKSAYGVGSEVVDLAGGTSQ